MVFVRDMEHALWSDIPRRQAILGYGWHCLVLEGELKKLSKTLQEEIHSIADVPDLLTKGKWERVFTAAELALLRERYEMWMTMRARVLATDEGEWILSREEEFPGGWFYLWTHYYDDLEAFYKWLQAVRTEVVQNPEKLVDCALSDACK